MMDIRDRIRELLSAPARELQVSPRIFLATSGVDTWAGSSTSQEAALSLILPGIVPGQGILFELVSAKILTSGLLQLFGWEFNLVTGGLFSAKRMTLDGSLGAVAQVDGTGTQQMRIALKLLTFYDLANLIAVVGGSPIVPQIAFSVYGNNNNSGAETIVVTLAAAVRVVSGLNE